MDDHFEDALREAIAEAAIIKANSDVERVIELTLRLKLILSASADCHEDTVATKLAASIGLVGAVIAKISDNNERRLQLGRTAALLLQQMLDDTPSKRRVN